MKKIVVASTNPVKIEAVRLGFSSMFPDQEYLFDNVSVPSGVKDQPTSDTETLLGAQNRSKNAALAIPEAAYWIGIEGGIESHRNEMAAYAWVVVRSSLLTGKARTGTFYLPPIVARLIQQGKELGEVDDIVFNKSNSKQKNGAIGILTADLITRAQLYEHAVLLALVPFKNKLLYIEQT